MKMPPANCKKIELRLANVSRGWGREVRPALFAVCALIILCCKDNPAPRRVASAEFGVLFGGQIQQRSEVALEFDPLKLTLALRVNLNTALAQAAPLHWELSRPGPRRGALQLAGPETRITEFGDETLSAGSTAFEKHFHIKPGDNPGLWNVRLSIADEVALDRPFTVFVPGERAQPQRRILLDAGSY
jgi:hypothetical protein